MRARTFAAAAMAVGLAASPAAAVVIDFEEQTNFTFVDSPLVYPDVTFTTPNRFFINGANVGRDLVAYLNGSGSGVLTVTFATAVTDLVFQTVGDNGFGTLYIAISFDDGDLLEITRGYDNIFETYDTHDLSAYTGIVGLVMYSSDAAGVAYDNFSFNPGSGGGGPTIPEPATWALMVAGFGLVGTAVRRRRVAVV
jgi:hypothetical protein